MGGSAPLSGPVDSFRRVRPAARTALPADQDPLFGGRGERNYLFFSVSNFKGRHYSVPGEVDSPTGLLGPEILGGD